MEQPIESAIIKEISNTLGIPETSISSGQSIEELGMTSILAVQLASKLEQQFGVKADMDGLSMHSTIGEVADYYKTKAK
ncbi:acyl carrier protein [Chitinophaga silvatica]|uniref:Acyl carrier protein n=1 Tax=Chitinophaga silvatica TaxID=2282649 RepID=A0A3E1YH53_9BACT|nr:acyl carrier protein [Chitinophaga silvatica]RFS26706.1 acyl carrier protein [Chitinophaga silvatica]